MRYCVFLFSFFLVNPLLSQNNNSNPFFSNFSLTILGGAAFNSIPTIGGSVIIEAGTEFNSRLGLKISFGYTDLYKNKEYILKTYNYFNIDNREGYQLNTYDIEKIQYSIIPVNFGIEYSFIKDLVSYYGLLEIGYNFYSLEEQIAISSSGGEYFNTFDQVPTEYRNSPPGVIDDSSYSIGLGAGLNYILSESLGLNLRYVFRYSDAIANANQILLGIKF